MNKIKKNKKLWPAAVVIQSISRVSSLHSYWVCCSSSMIQFSLCSWQTVGQLSAHSRLQCSDGLVYHRHTSEPSCPPSWWYPAILQCTEGIEVVQAWNLVGHRRSTSWRRTAVLGMLFAASCCRCDVYVMWMWCWCGVIVMLMWWGCDVDVMWICDVDVIVMLMWCGWDVDVMWMGCWCDVDVMWHGARVVKVLASICVWTEQTQVRIPLRIYLFGYMMRGGCDVDVMLMRCWCDVDVDV